MNFKENYFNSPDSLKLQFLESIIMGDTGLQNEFLKLVAPGFNSEDNLSYISFLELVRSEGEDYRYQFEEVDTENPDWENYHSSYSEYIEEYEAYRNASEQEFEAIFSRFRADATDTIIRQKADEVVAMLIGLYEATRVAEIADEVESFADVNGYLKSEHTATMNVLIEKLRLSNLSDAVIRGSFEMFFKYCDTECTGEPHYARHFEQLLIALAEKAHCADQLLDIFNKSGVEQLVLPELLLLLNKKAGNNSEWLSTARQFYRHNESVAKQMLEFYFETDKGSFLETAKELIAANSYVWATFLQPYVSPNLDESLYVKVFRELAIQKKEIGHYLKIREYLTGPALEEFLNEVASHTVFYVKILEVEKRYMDIKEKKKKNPDDWYFIEIITPILCIYPEFCFLIIRNKAVRTLQNERGRHVYERIVSWLLLAKTIRNFEAETNELVLNLFNHKPNLPALRDEMRKAGLVLK